MIWFHITILPGRTFAYSGLIVFTLLLAYFNKSSEKKTIGCILKEKLVRLGIPWAAWFGIYLTLGIATGKLRLSTDLARLDFLLTGPWVGLWFLPFAIGVSITSSLIYKIPKRINIFICITLAIISLPAAYVIRTMNVGSPWSQWIHAAPAIPIGWLMASVKNSKHQTNAGFSLIILLCSYAFIFDQDKGLTLPHLIGSSLSILAILYPLPCPRVLRNAAPTLLGVYLIHGGIISIIVSLTITRDAYILFGITSITSISTIYLMRTLKPLKLIT